MIKGIDMISGLNISVLTIGQDAQRKLSLSKVDKMVRNYDPKQLEPITVSLRADGTYHVVDGQHRVRMCKLLGMTEIPARIIEGLEAEQESKLFIMLDKNKLKLTSKDKFLGLVNAKSAHHREILDIITKYGFSVTTDNSRRSMITRISAIGTVDKIAKTMGLDILASTLHLISSTWKNNPQAIHFQFMEATAKFINKYSGKPSFDFGLAEKQLKVLDPRKTLAQAKGTQNCTPVDSIMTNLVNTYNYRLVSRKRIS
jgi:hypothetical protein